MRSERSDGARTPSFLELDVARAATGRELDALVTLAASLADDDWSRPTPSLEGWTIRDLVEHVATIPGHGYWAGRLRAARLGDRSGPTENAPPPLEGDAVAALRRGAAELEAELAHLTEDDLDRLLYVMPGRRQLLRSALGSYVFELGLHRYDLELALGRRVDLAPDVCRAVVLMAETDGYRADVEGPAPWGGARPAPTEDVSYVLRGETVEWSFSFTAAGEPRLYSPVTHGRWEPGVRHPDRCCTVTGTDAAICLVLAGRLATHDDRVTATAGFPSRFFTTW